MSLSVALNTARTALQTTATQIAVSGSNIAGADDPTRSRKIALPTTDPTGSSHVVTITRATDHPAADAVSRRRSRRSASSQALLDGLNRLQDTVGDTADGTSPAARIAALATALQALANAPADRSLGQAAVTVSAVGRDDAQQRQPDRHHGSQRRRHRHGGVGRPSSTRCSPSSRPLNQTVVCGNQRRRRRHRRARPARRPARPDQRARSASRSCVATTTTWRSTPTAA